MPVNRIVYTCERCGKRSYADCPQDSGADFARLQCGHCGSTTVGNVRVYDVIYKGGN